MALFNTSKILACCTVVPKKKRFPSALLKKDLKQLQVETRLHDLVQLFREL